MGKGYPVKLWEPIGCWCCRCPNVGDGLDLEGWEKGVVVVLEEGMGRMSKWEGGLLGWQGG